LSISGYVCIAGRMPAVTGRVDRSRNELGVRAMFSGVSTGRRVGGAALLVIAALGVLIAQPPGARAQEPGVAVGDLPPQGGVALVRWGGGTIGELEEAVPAATSFWVTHAGVPVSYIPSAP